MYFEFRELEKNEASKASGATRQSSRTERCFGVYERAAAGDSLIGSARVVEAFLERRAKYYAEPLLPLVHDFVATTRVRPALDRIIQKHGMVVELRDLTVSRRCRGLSVRTFFVECLAAVYGTGIRVPILATCCEEQKRAFTRVGFHQILRSERLVGSDALVLRGIREQNIEVETRNNLRRILELYRGYGAVGFCADRRGDVVPNLFGVNAQPSILRLALRIAA